MFLRFSFTSHYPYLILLAINSVNISDSKLFCPLWCLVSQPSQSLSQLMNMLYVLSPVYLQRGVRERSLVGVWHPTTVNPLHQHWNIWGTNTGKSNCITPLLPHLKHTQYKSTEAKKNPKPKLPQTRPSYISPAIPPLSHPNHTTIITVHHRLYATT